MEGWMMSWRGWFLLVGQGGGPIAGWLAQSLSNVTGVADLHGTTAADLLVEFPSYTTKVQKGWDNQLSVTRISAERTDKPINCMRMAWIASDHFCLLRMNCIHDSSWIPYGFLMDSSCFASLWTLHAPWGRANRAMQFDRRDRCLHICMLGDAGIGHSSFLKCYGAAAGDSEKDWGLEAWRPKFEQTLRSFVSPGLSC